MSVTRVEVYAHEKTEGLSKACVYLVESRRPPVQDILRRIFSRPIIETCVFNSSAAAVFLGGLPGAEVFYRPGVTDNIGRTASVLLEAFGVEARVASGSIFYGLSLSEEELLRDVEGRCANTLIQVVSPLGGDRFRTGFFPKVDIGHGGNVESFPIEGDLMELSRRRCLALDGREMEAIVSHYRGLGRDRITDVEIEILAQTWSEHCKHKIFAASIDYSESDHDYKKIGNKHIDSLFKTYIAGATDEVRKRMRDDILVSVFGDNAGIVRLDDNIDLCFKVETHNSPSALDPYGGALTGILGVNRDILGCGLGAKPIANTDVFCLPPLSLEDSLCDLPENVMAPRRMLEGVHAGVEDGGNKSGIPTVGGAILFDESYAGKPLVYVGTVGVMPRRINGRPTALKAARDGDFIYMAGGDVGIDGIHGATFSSMELDESSPVSAVQIGDPFVQKMLSDFLLEARDLGLFNSVTDNGAGGLSSSVGEMADDCGGACLDLDAVPLKYPGLSAWEIVVSESQERMTFAVEPGKSAAFEALARRFAIKATRIGNFESSGYFTVKSGGSRVAKIAMDFLHRGTPRMELTAHWDGPRRQPNPYRGERGGREKGSPLEVLKDLLASPNIASKEYLVRRYDHEVQGQSVVKPFYQAKGTGPSDAGVVGLEGYGGGRNNAVAIGCGINPFLSEIDPYLMALSCVDECVRNLLCSGANLGGMVLLDNFCWPDPVASPHNPEGSYRLGQLVRTAEGLYDICRAYGLALISGKDSMKNDYEGRSRRGERLSFGVLPTLLVSGMARTDIRHIVPSFARKPGELLVEIGMFGTKRLVGSACDRLSGIGADGSAAVDLAEHFRILRAVEELRNKKVLTCLHDVSDGGAAVALVEILFVNGFGASLDVPSASRETALFGEAMTCFVATVAREDLVRLEDALPTRLWGEVDSSGQLELGDCGTIGVAELMDCWSGGLRREHEG